MTRSSRAVLVTSNTLVTNKAREHGCHFLTPVNTARGTVYRALICCTWRHISIIKQLIFRSLCDLMTLQNIRNGANLRLPLDAQNTKRIQLQGALPPDLQKSPVTSYITQVNHIQFGD